MVLTEEGDGDALGASACQTNVSLLEVDLLCVPVPLSMDTLFDVEEKRSVSDSSSVGVSVFLKGVGCVGSVDFVSSLLK